MRRLSLCGFRHAATHLDYPGAGHDIAGPPPYAGTAEGGGTAAGNAAAIAEPRRMNILIVAFEDGRWGPARLVQPLHAAGFAVAALCPGGNPVAQTRFLDRHFPLADTRSSRHVGRRLAAAIATWQPHLVIPADERSVACLQAILRQPGTAGLCAAARALLTRSLGDPARFDALLLKSATLALARTQGVCVPSGATVCSADAATAQAAALGFPLYLKTSFSWAGQGVTLCADAPALSAALDAALPRRSRLRDWLRRRLHRDWYPTDSAIDLQRPVAGVPAMYCAVALQGRLLAGFAATALQTVSATGPSSRVRLAAHAEMARVAATMVSALGASGFIGFDFMQDHRARSRSAISGRASASTSAPPSRRPCAASRKQQRNRPA
eukprot:gene1922-2600_t